MTNFDPPAPVRLISRRLVCQNSKLRVYFDHIEEGDKRVLDYAVVTCLNETEGRRFETGVLVLPMDVSRGIGLQRVWRHPIGAWAWEAPRGFMEPGETAADAAGRELSEEAGLHCLQENLIPLGTITSEAGVIRGRMVLFCAKHVSAGQRTDEEIGIGGLHWFPLQEALRMADTSVIEDAPTLAALYRFARQSVEIR